MTRDHKCIGLTISWNGKGFNPDLLEKSNGYGWKNINTRLNQLEGSIFIDSSPNKEFTTILIDIPNKSQEQYGKTG